MELTSKQFKFIQAIIFAAVLTVVFVTAITIIADMYNVGTKEVPVLALKNWLKNTFFNHHWVGKGVLAIIVFFVSTLILFFVLPAPSEEVRIKKIAKSICALTIISIACSIILFAFFYYEAFLKH